MVGFKELRDFPWRSAARRPGAGPRDLRLGDFGQGCWADQSRGSGLLALEADDVSRPEVLQGATDDEVIGIGRAWRALETWVFARKIGVVRELIRRYPANERYEVDQAGGLPAEWDPRLHHEIAAALGISTVAAGKLANLAWTLEARLPGIGQALERNKLDPGRVKMIADETSVLDREDLFAKVEQIILAGLANCRTWTDLLRVVQGAVITVDPEGAEKRRLQAERENARIRFWHENSGTCGLQGTGLPTDQALAAHANIEARALEYKAVPIRQKIDILRVMAYLDILNGVTVDQRIAWAQADEAARKAEDEKLAAKAERRRAAQQAKAKGSREGEADGHGEDREDGGSSGGPDSSGPGGGAPDGGAPDGGAPDGGAPDGGAPDGGAPDGGGPDSDGNGDPSGGGPDGDYLGGGGSGLFPGEWPVDPEGRDTGRYGGPGGLDEGPGEGARGRPPGGDGHETGGQSGSDGKGGSGERGGGACPQCGGAGGVAGLPLRASLTVPVAALDFLAELAAEARGPTGGSRRGGPGDRVSSGAVPVHFPRAGHGAAAARACRSGSAGAPAADAAGPGRAAGEAHGLGALNPGLMRDLAAAGARHPGSQFCLTVVDKNGYAIGHGCCRPMRGKKGAVLVADPDRVTIPPSGRAGPEGGFGSWIVALPGGRRPFIVE